MKVFIEIATTDAIRAGRSQSGWLPVELDDAALGAMTQAQRDTLATHRGHEAHLPRYLGRTPTRVPRPAPVEATIATLIEQLDWLEAESTARAGEQAKRLAAEKEATEARVQRLLVQPLEDLIRVGFGGETDPRLAGRRAEVDAEQRTRDAQAAAKRQAERQAERDAEKALQERQALARAAWVAERGTASQRARLAAGVLPIVEVVDAIRAEKFAPLAETARYERLAREDMAAPEEEGDCEHSDLNFAVDDANELTEAQFAALSAIKTLAPRGAIVQPRIHTATCDDCDETTSRCSALVTVDWFGAALSREYALPDAVM